MVLPKFLLADNTDFQNDIFIIHTEYPQFVVNLVNDDIEWLEEVEISDETALSNEVTELIELASKFYDREMERYEKE